VCAAQALDVWRLSVVHRFALRMCATLPGQNRIKEEVAATKDAKKDIQRVRLHLTSEEWAQQALDRIGTCMRCFAESCDVRRRGN
jgi:nitrate/TMAO reductase-like tetraheme cytochrome c subunit